MVEVPSLLENRGIFPWSILSFYLNYIISPAILQKKIQFQIPLKSMKNQCVKKITHCIVKFEAGEENRIVYESL